MEARYIALEGPDGAGKTTQMALLEKAFAAAAIPLVRVREPGSTPVGEDIRKILLTGDNDKLTPMAEALLFSAQRNVLVEKVIRPALAQGTWVLADRTFLTTLAFQGYGRGMDVDVLKELTHLAIGDTRPHLMVVLDVPPETGLSRKGVQQAEGLTETRFESVGQAFHTRNREGFLQYVKDEPTRAVRIEATGTVEAVHTAIVEAINAKFGLSLTPQKGAA